MVKKILIVEDEESLSKVLCDKFLHDGFEVLKAEDGKVGLKLALENKPDVILLDIIMPVMDGITMLEKLREDDWGKTAEVILLSNLSDGKEISKALASGVRDYLIKCNWEIDDVVAKVEEKLK